jgi:4-hydroxythreonine-4-phosphate dehydrogenase
MIPRIGLTLGDPAGIGPEIVMKSLPEMAADYIPVIIGSQRIVERSRRFADRMPEIIPVESFDGLKHKAYIHDCEEVDFEQIETGKESAESGRVSHLWVVEAAKLALAGAVDAVVTGPISKSAWRMAGFDFPGHTELLAFLSGTDDYGMMMVSDELRVLLVTTHVSIAEVPARICLDDIRRKISLAHRALRSLFGIVEPRIGVCGLNPHGGEQSVLGREEIDEIGPAVRRCQDEGVAVEGPFPSDTLFSKRHAYDCIIAMYHDQGLIPFKLLSFGKGVNLTTGLPFIRTSPDHGTAYGIAGRGIANPSSMCEAIRLAVELTRKKTGR